MKRKDSFSKTHKWTWYLKCTLTPLWLVLISVGAGGNLATSQSKPQELELARGGGLVVAWWPGEVAWLWLAWGDALTGALLI